MSIFHINPNPTPGAGKAFADVEVHLISPVRFIALVSGPPNGHLYYHKSPLSKVPTAGEIPVTGTESWIPLAGVPRSFPVIKLAYPVQSFFMSGDGDTVDAPDFMLLCTDEFELVPQLMSQIAYDDLNFGQVTVQNVATRIDAPNPNRVGIMVINHGTTDVFIGKSSAVTVNNGALLPGVKGAAMTIPTTSDIWGIVAVGSQLVSFIEVFE